MTLPFPSLADKRFSELALSSDLPLGSSPLTSSNSVAYESCADDVRLPGGEGMLSRDTALLSPPFKRLGVAEYDRMEPTRLEPRMFFLRLFSRDAILRPPDDSRCCVFPSTGEVVVEGGLEFWLFGTPFGGCGKEPTLIVLRRALAGFVAGEMPLTDLGVGKPVEEPLCNLA